MNHHQYTPQCVHAQRHLSLLVVHRLDKSTSYVFMLEDEKVPRRKLHDLWTEARDRAQIKDLIWHDLRRTCGQRMLDAGASIEAVQAQLGHERTETTQRAYVTPSVTQAKEGVSLLRGGSFDGVEELQGGVA
ncbi:MAG TPA: tyrosine-type recombinase/integrase [Gammaproteobacteria bacterium]|nr:tyrosine-type recombinase/integrase [Gammaproteobacteria bacterium]